MVTNRNVKHRINGIRIFDVDINSIKMRKILKFVKRMLVELGILVIMIQ